MTIWLDMKKDDLETILKLLEPHKDEPVVDKFLSLVKKEIVHWGWTEYPPTFSLANKPY